MDMNRQEWKEKAAEMSGVPKDVAMGLPILTITGTDELCVENYRGITEYTDQIIRLQTRCGQIKIGGRKLEVSRISDMDFSEAFRWLIVSAIFTFSSRFAAL